MTTFPTQELLTAVYNRLAGEDGEGQELSYHVYTAGSVPTEAPDEAVIVDVPRTSGSEFIGGSKRFDVRHSVRAHTRFPPAKADRTKALAIAASIHEALDAAPLDLQGFRSPHLPVPTQRPIPAYDVAGEKGYDVALEYRYFL